MTNCRVLLLAGVLVLVLAPPAFAQSFSSGSTGADGALVAPAGTTTCVRIPESGVLNYTTVTVQGTLAFIPNTRNGPVSILAQGAVLVDTNGRINVSARSGSTTFCGEPPYSPGPGGYWGGFNSNGEGPGGGTSTSVHGRWVGPTSLLPMVGGSGGYPTTNNDRAGAGGGAVLIVSSSSVFVKGAIVADGHFSYGGSGSGGAIRLVAPIVDVTGSLSARGSSTGNNPGLIRIEAPVAGRRIVTTNIGPSAIASEINPLIAPGPSTPTLTIVSIGGQPVPPGPGSSNQSMVDVLLPTGLVDPIPIVVSASNVPVGTLVKVVSSAGTGTTANLAGTLASSAATLTVSGLSRSGRTQLSIYCTFDVPQQAAAFNPEGVDRIAAIRLATTPGAGATTEFLRGDGSVIPRDRLSPQLLSLFGR